MKRIKLLIDIIKKNDFQKLIEIIYFKVNKRKYNYVNSCKEKDVVQKNIHMDMRILVYTCVLGNYDKIIEPEYHVDQIDYYLITDDLEKYKESKWNCLDINDYYSKGSNIEKNRYIKIHPHLLFENYDYSIYIDGNVQVLKGIEDICKSLFLTNKFLGVHRHNQRDCVYREAEALHHLRRFKDILPTLEKQINCYETSGFPKHYGLYENTILIRQHDNEKCKTLMEEWWNQMQTYTLRDQISLPYAIYLTNLKEYIFILGNDLKKNDCFKYNFHA